MLEQDKKISVLSVIGGFGLGLVLSLGMLFLAVVIGSLIGENLLNGHKPWIFPAIEAVLLVVAGFLAFQRFDDSGLARGIVIGLSMALVLDGVCGVAMLK